MRHWLNILSIYCKNKFRTIDAETRHVRITTSVNSKFTGSNKRV